MEWWIMVLAIPVLALPLLRPRQSLDLGISVDASTVWGISLIWQKSLWDAWRMLPGWSGPGRHITWLECVAVDIIAMILDCLDMRNAHVLMMSDNQGVIGAATKPGLKPDI
jgi:hypothetical protein